jgi:hypothetical protein
LSRVRAARFRARRSSLCRSRFLADLVFATYSPVSVRVLPFLKRRNDIRAREGCQAMNVATTGRGRR